MRISNFSSQSLAQGARQLKKLQDRHNEVIRHEEAHYRGNRRSRKGSRPW